MGQVAEDEQAKRGGYAQSASRCGGRLLVWLLSGLTGLANRFSIERVIAVGAGIGRLWYRLGLPRTDRVRRQLERSFPGESKQHLDTTALGVFEHLGRSLAELIILRGRHREVLLAGIEVEGIENLERAEDVSDGGGLLVVSAHYGNWELAGIYMATLGIPVSAIFRGFAHPVLDEALSSLRRSDGSASVDYEQIRMGRAAIALARALKAGRKALVLLDQNARRDEGCFVPFFGRPACVRTGPLQLARRVGTPIVPAFIRRDVNGVGRHRIRIHPPLWIEAEARGEEASIESCAAQLTAIIESEIREDPTQWIWTHGRWRTQPIAD